jgi:glycosyltransferase involved in cell wall biosynthesis
VFAGAGENEYLKKFAEENNLSHRVKFTGRLTKEEYDDIIREADIGVVLRKEPTHGETSAALFDLLAAGIPTIVSNVGTFKEMPDNALIKVGNKSPILIAKILDVLLQSEVDRQHFGQAGREYVKQNHNPARTAEIYTKVILGR